MEGTVLRYPDQKRPGCFGHAYAKQSDFLIAGDILQRIAELNPNMLIPQRLLSTRAQSTERFT